MVHLDGLRRQFLKRSSNTHALAMLAAAIISAAAPTPVRAAEPGVTDNEIKIGILGSLTGPAHMRPFGVYSGYFTDPDGHLFEIAWDSGSR